jgi:hypothetical protein
MQRGGLLGVLGVFACIALVALLHRVLRTSTDVAWVTAILACLVAIGVVAALDARRRGRSSIVTLAEHYFWAGIFVIPTLILLLSVVTVASFCACLSDPECEK